MDQLKSFFTFVGKQHFWILGAIVAASAVICFFMARNDLLARKQKNISEIDTKLSAVRSVATSQPKNDTWIAAATKLRTEADRSIFDAQKVLYDRQRQVLTWPKTLMEVPVFRQAVERLMRDPTYDMPQLTREMYKNYAKEEVADLAKVVDARMNEEELGLVSMTPEALAAEMQKGKVRWEIASKMRFKQNYFWESTPPTTQEILLVQEDLWVLRNLFEIIRRVNLPANGRYDAAIKTIVDVSIGSDAAMGWKMTEPVTTFSPASGEGGMGAYGAYGGYGAYGAYGGGTEGSTEGGTGQTGAPVSGYGGYGGYGPAAMNKVDQMLNNRYLDPATLEPIASMGEGEGSASGPEGDVKLMPIYMVLVTDQRRIANLLAECNNAYLPVEVTQVTFYREDPQGIPSPTGPGGGQGYPGGGGRGGYGAYGGGYGAYGGHRTGASLNLSAQFGSHRLVQYGPVGPPPGMAPGAGGYGGGYGAYGGRGGYGAYGGGYPGAGGYGGFDLLSDPEVSQNDVTLTLKGIVYVYKQPTPPVQDGSTEETQPAQPAEEAGELAMR